MKFYEQVFLFTICCCPASSRNKGLTRTPVARPVEWGEMVFNSKLLSHLGLHLQGEYSRLLYGEESQVDVENLSVIWLSLLSPPALDAIHSAGVCAGETLRLSKKLIGDSRVERVLYAPHSPSATPLNSVWIYSPVLKPAPSHSWVEVTHCQKNQRTSGAIPGIWFYVAPGSGVSINVGQTVVVDERAHHPKEVSSGILKDVMRSAYAFQHNIPKNMSKVAKRLVNTFPNKGSLGFDSLQRIYHTQRGGQWETVQHEIVFLGNGPSTCNECINMFDLPGVKCGKWPNLFPCPNAIKKLMTNCGCCFSGELKSKIQLTNCTD